MFVRSLNEKEMMMNLDLTKRSLRVKEDAEIFVKTILLMMMTTNYFDLMHIAAENAAKGAKQAQKKVFSLGRQKELSPKQVKLNNGVKKFLQQREEEDRKKALEERKKKENLLALRSQDRKAVGRIRRGLKMTKSANKACMADAQDSLDASLATQGEYQPDNDDFGYSSTAADDMHRKYLEKYKSTVNPTSKKSSPMSVDIPKSQSLPSSKSSSGKSKPEVQEKLVPQKVLSKSKPPPPPRPSYEEMLQLAEKKHLEPVVPKKPKVEKDEEVFEFGRPMTYKEKQRFLQEKMMKEKMLSPNSNGLNSSSQDQNNNSVNSKRQGQFKIPMKKTETSPGKQKSLSPPVQPAKLSNSSSKLNVNEEVPMKQKIDKPKGKPDAAVTASPKSTPSLSPSSHIKSNGELKSQKQRLNGVESSEKIQKQSQSTSQTRLSIPKGTDTSISSKESVRKSKPQALESTSLKKVVKKRSDVNIVANGKSTIPSKIQEKSCRPREPIKPRYIDEFERGKKNVPSRKLIQREEITPNPRFSKGRSVIESDEEEEEYDPEMDDFIDDSEVDNEHISSIIGSIFKYNKRKYEDWSDDECEESSYRQQQCEEIRSLKIGIAEDLEDMRREEEEKRRKEVNMKSFSLKKRK